MKIMLLTLLSFVVSVTDSFILKVTFVGYVCIYEATITRGFTENIKKFELIFDDDTSGEVKSFKCLNEVCKILDIW